MTIICNVNSGVTFGGIISADDYFFGIYSFLDRKEILKKSKKQHRKCFMSYGTRKRLQVLYTLQLAFSTVFPSLQLLRKHNGLVAFVKQLLILWTI